MDINKTNFTSRKVFPTISKITSSFIEKNYIILKNIYIYTQRELFLPAYALKVSNITIPSDYRHS